MDSFTQILFIPTRRAPAPGEIINQLNYTEMKIQKISIFLFLFVIIAAFTSCSKETPKKDEQTDKTKVADTTKKQAPNYDEAIKKIEKFRAEGEQKLNDNKFTRKTVQFKDDKIKETIKQKWEKMDAYYEGDKLVRIQLYPHKGISERTEEFYLIDNKLVFAFIQDQGPKHEGKDMGEAGKEMYFDGGKLIKYENRTGSEVKNLDEEKKMYELRLPYEVEDLLEILKTAK